MLASVGATRFDHLYVAFKTMRLHLVFHEFIEVLAPILLTLASAAGIEHTFRFLLHAINLNR